MSRPYQHSYEGGSSQNNNLTPDAFKTNIHRNKTRRWAEAPKVDYGEGWGDDDDYYDESDTHTHGLVSPPSHHAPSRAYTDIGLGASRPLQRQPSFDRGDDRAHGHARSSTFGSGNNGWQGQLPPTPSQLEQQELMRTLPPAIRAGHPQGSPLPQPPPPPPPHVLPPQLHVGPQHQGVGEGMTGEYSAPGRLPTDLPSQFQSGMHRDEPQHYVPNYATEPRQPAVDYQHPTQFRHYSQAEGPSNQSWTSPGSNAPHHAGTNFEKPTPALPPPEDHTLQTIPEKVQEPARNYPTYDNYENSYYDGPKHSTQQHDSYYQEQPQHYAPPRINTSEAPVPSSMLSPTSGKPRIIRPSDIYKRHQDMGARPGSEQNSPVSTSRPVEQRSAPHTPGNVTPSYVPYTAYNPSQVSSPVHSRGGSRPSSRPTSSHNSRSSSRQGRQSIQPGYVPYSPPPRGSSMAQPIQSVHALDPEPHAFAAQDWRKSGNPDTPGWGDDIISGYSAPLETPQTTKSEYFTPPTGQSRTTSSANVLQSPIGQKEDPSAAFQEVVNSAFVRQDTLPTPHSDKSVPERSISPILSAPPLPPKEILGQSTSAPFQPPKSPIQRAHSPISRLPSPGPGYQIPPPRSPIQRIPSPIQRIASPIQRLPSPNTTIVPKRSVSPILRKPSPSQITAEQDKPLDPPPSKATLHDGAKRMSNPIMVPPVLAPSAAIVENASPIESNDEKEHQLDNMIIQSSSANPGDSQSSDSITAPGQNDAPQTPGGGYLATPGADHNRESVGVFSLYDSYFEDRPASQNSQRPQTPQQRTPSPPQPLSSPIRDPSPPPIQPKSPLRASHARNQSSISDSMASPRNGDVTIAIVPSSPPPVPIPGAEKRAAETIDEPATPASSVDEELLEMMSTGRKFLDRRATGMSVRDKGDSDVEDSKMDGTEEKDATSPLRQLGPDSEGIEAVGEPTIVEPRTQSREEESEFNKELVNQFSRPQTLRLKDPLAMPTGTMVMPPMPPTLKGGEETAPEVVNFDNDEGELQPLQVLQPPMMEESTVRPMTATVRETKNGGRPTIQDTKVISTLSTALERTKAYDALRQSLIDTPELIQDWVAYQMQQNNGDQLLRAEIVAVKTDQTVKKSRSRIGLGHFPSRSMDYHYEESAHKAEEKLAQVGRGALKLGEQAGAKVGATVGGWMKRVGKKGHSSKDSVSDNKGLYKGQPHGSIDSLATSSIAPTGSRRVSIASTMPERNSISGSLSSRPTTGDIPMTSPYPGAIPPQLPHIQTQFQSRFPAAKTPTSGIASTPGSGVENSRQQTPNQYYCPVLSDSPAGGHQHTASTGSVSFPARTDSLFSNPKTPQYAQPTQPVVQPVQPKQFVPPSEPSPVSAFNKRSDSLQHSRESSLAISLGQSSPLHSANGAPQISPLRPQSGTTSTSDDDLYSAPQGPKPVMSEQPGPGQRSMPPQGQQGQGPYGSVSTQGQGQPPFMASQPVPMNASTHHLPPPDHRPQHLSTSAPATSSPLAATAGSRDAQGQGQGQLGLQGQGQGPNPNQAYVPSSSVGPSGSGYNVPPRGSGPQLSLFPPPPPPPPPQARSLGLVKSLSSLGSKKTEHYPHAQNLPAQSATPPPDVKKEKKKSGSLFSKIGVGRSGSIGSQTNVASSDDGHGFEPKPLVKRTTFLGMMGKRKTSVDHGPGLEKKEKGHKKGFSDMFLRGSSFEGKEHKDKDGRDGKDSNKGSVSQRLAMAGLAGGKSGGAAALVEPKIYDPKTGTYMAYGERSGSVGSQGTTHSEQVSSMQSPQNYIPPANSQHQLPQNGQQGQQGQYGKGQVPMYRQQSIPTRHASAPFGSPGPQSSTSPQPEHQPHRQASLQQHSQPQQSAGMQYAPPPLTQQPAPIQRTFSPPPQLPPLPRFDTVRLSRMGTTSSTASRRSVDSEPQQVVRDGVYSPPPNVQHHQAYQQQQQGEYAVRGYDSQQNQGYSPVAAIGQHGSIRNQYNNQTSGQQYAQQQEQQEQPAQKTQVQGHPAQEQYQPQYHQQQQHARGMSLPNQAYAPQQPQQQEREQYPQQQYQPQQPNRGPTPATQNQPYQPPSPLNLQQQQKQYVPSQHSRGATPVTPNFPPSQQPVPYQPGHQQGHQGHQGQLGRVGSIPGHPITVGHSGQQGLYAQHPQHQPGYRAVSNPEQIARNGSQQNLVYQPTGQGQPVQYSPVQSQFPQHQQRQEQQMQPQQGPQGQFGQDQLAVQQHYSASVSDQSPQLSRTGTAASHSSSPTSFVPPPPKQQQPQMQQQYQQSPPALAQQYSQHAAQHPRSDSLSRTSFSSQNPEQPMSRRESHRGSIPQLTVPREPSPTSPAHAPLSAVAPSHSTPPPPATILAEPGVLQTESLPPTTQTRGNYLPISAVETRPRTSDREMRTPHIPTLPSLPTVPSFTSHSTLVSAAREAIDERDERNWNISKDGIEGQDPGKILPPLPMPPQRNNSLSSTQPSSESGGVVLRKTSDRKVQETGGGAKEEEEDGRNYGREQGQERESGKEGRETRDTLTPEDDKKIKKQRRVTARDEKMVVRHEGDGEKILASEAERRGQETDEEDYGMSSTAYPGQQWEPEYYWS
ncbi:hypothetical protein BZA77DRAFT_325272 [Pyronema omphalodes]|nr:hypothetical protein BZA77DRAFT_325272 [Pyronema omphalodes]